MLRTWPLPRSNDTGIFVSDVIRGGAADSDGRLLPGDQILSINGVDVRAASQDHAQKLLQVRIASRLAQRSSVWWRLGLAWTLMFPFRAPAAPSSWKWLVSKPGCSTHARVRWALKMMSTFTEEAETRIRRVAASSLCLQIKFCSNSSF